MLLLALADHPAFPRDEIAEERERARIAASRIELEWPLAPTGPVTRFIRALGVRLARAELLAAIPVGGQWDGEEFCRLRRDTAPGTE